MYKIAIMGDRDSVLGFKAVGFDVFPVNDSLMAENTLKDLCGQNYAVIYVTEDTAEDIYDTIQKYKGEKLPAIILIPSRNGPLGIGMRNVKKSVEQAVGSDILFNGD